MIYLRTTPPDELPVALADLRAHLRRDDLEEDILLEAYLEAAVAHLDGVAGELHACLITQGWTAFADRPEPIGRGSHHDVMLGRWPYGPSGFRITLGPVQIDVPITVQCRTGGSWATVSPSVFSTVPDRLGGALLVPNPGASWPLADQGPGAWRLTFTAGFGDDATDVPAPIRAAILMLAGDLDQNREAKTIANLVPNATIAALLGPYRRISV